MPRAASRPALLVRWGVTRPLRVAARFLGAGAVLTVLLAAWPVSGIAQGPPINTKDAFVTGMSDGAFRTFFLTFGRSGLLLDGNEAPDPLDREVRVKGLMSVLPYELVPNRLVVNVGAPYLDKSLELGPQADRQELSATGFGDLALGAKLAIYQHDRPSRTTRVALLGRLKLPTGEDDATGPDGQLLPRSLQLGTGSVDYSLGAATTHSVGRVGLSGDLIYDINTAAGESAFGDVLHYDLALGYRALPQVYRTYPAKQLNLYLEANGTWSRHDALVGHPVADSGGSVLRISPGVQFIPGAGFLVEATYQVPVWQDLNGAQLSFGPTFKVGIRWLLS